MAMYNWFVYIHCKAEVKVNLYFLRLLIRNVLQKMYKDPVKKKRIKVTSSINVIASEKLYRNRCSSYLYYVLFYFYSLGFFFYSDSFFFFFFWKKNCWKNIKYQDCYLYIKRRKSVAPLYQKQLQQFSINKFSP